MKNCDIEICVTIQLGTKEFYWRTFTWSEGKRWQRDSCYVKISSRVLLTLHSGISELDKSVLKKSRNYLWHLISSDIGQYIMILYLYFFVLHLIMTCTLITDKCVVCGWQIYSSVTHITGDRITSDTVQLNKRHIYGGSMWMLVKWPNQNSTKKLQHHTILGYI